MSEASNKNTTPDATSNTTPATPAATPAKKPDQRQRGPRPPADARGRAANPGQGGARAAGSPQPSARPQGAQPARGPRTERTDNDNAARPPRAARPEGARDQQPRAAQQQQARGPRPEGAPGPQARGPRPDGTADQQRGPRPDGAPRGPRGPRLTPEEQAAKAAEKAFRNPLPPITYPQDLPGTRSRPVGHDRPHAAAPHRRVVDGQAHRAGTGHAARRHCRFQGTLRRHAATRRVGQADDRRYPVGRNPDRPAA